ncbi:argininosuccinate lyase [Candidatus Vidania fulgoroideorum]
MKTWSKRFDEKNIKEFSFYTCSIKKDKKLIKEELLCIKAHSLMLYKINIINKKDIKKIINGLKYIKTNKKKFNYKIELEDIHMNLENILISIIGNTGKKIRIARSRNDLVTTDLKMWIKTKIKKIIKLIKKIIFTILNISKKNYNTIIPGFTHFQIAQPVTYGHYLLSYCEMFKRDIYRLKNCYNLLNYLPLGSCALAGTNFKTNRIFLAKQLGFKKLCRNSIDAVSDRDYVLDFLYSCSVVFVHITRYCEECIIFCNSCFGFYTFSDKICSGSSVMPQKKNPDSFEIMRAKASVLIGNLFSFFNIIKSLPLAYNKDYQEDKSLVFKSYKTLKTTLVFLNKIIKLIKINKKKMLKISKENFSTATDLADYLSSLGIPFKKSHEIVSFLVNKSLKQKKKISKLNIDFIKQYINTKKFILLKTKINSIMKVKNSVLNKISTGGTAPKNVLKEILIFEKKIKKCYIK